MQRDDDLNPEQNVDSEDSRLDVMHTVLNKKLFPMLNAIDDDPEIFNIVLRSKSESELNSEVKTIFQEITDLGCICIAFGDYYTTDLGSKIVDMIIRSREGDWMWDLMCNCDSNDDLT